MVVISECLYSSKVSKEIIKRTLQMMPLPEFLSINGPYTIMKTKYLIKSITIYEFDESKFLEALEYIGLRLSNYRSVPVYDYHINIWNHEESFSDI